MKYGICGYGNLGKCLEKKLQTSSDDEIVGIFSRRNLNFSLLGNPIYDLELVKKFAGKIDVMLMCGGSQEDLLWQSPEMLKYFNIIDTFDTHGKIKLHRKNLEKVQKESGKTAIFSCGWDPGLFSIARVLGASVFSNEPQTFWGRGISQGHSEALRNILGVKDAIEITEPNMDILKKVEDDPYFLPDQNKKHIRYCYISLDGTRDAPEIINEIENMPYYFKGQNVKVTICFDEDLKAFKEKMFHEGVVFAGDKQSKLTMKVSMESNPDFTSNILLAYSKALPKLESGVYSVLDVPLSLIGNIDSYKEL